jgi:O-antigen ligase
MNSRIIKTLKVLLYSTPAVAMIVGSSMIFPFITAKSFAFRLIVELCAMLYVALAIVDKSYRPKKNYLFISFATFVAVMFVADVFALNPIRAFWSNFERMEGFVLIAHLFAYLTVLAMVLREKRDWYTMLYSTVAVSVFMTFFAYLQFFGGAVINQGGVRLDGTLGNSAYLATYMVFHIFFLLYLWVSDKNKVKGISNAVAWGSAIYILYYLYKITVNDDMFNFTYSGGVILLLAFLTIVKMVVIRTVEFYKKFEHLSIHGLYASLILAELGILYYTATRGATLGLIGGIVLAAFIIVFTERENKKVRKIASTILVIIIVLIAGFYSVRKSDFVQHSPVLNRFANISLNDPTQARAIIWPMAIESFIEHPVLGWGQDNFIYAFTKYYRPELIRHEAWFDRTHNTYLDWLVAGGALGFIAYLSLYLFGVWTLAKSRILNNREKSILLGLFFAYGFLNLFIFDNLVSYVMFMILLALADFSGRNIEVDHKTKVEEVDPGLLVILISVFIGGALLVNYKPYEQNVTLAKGISNIRTDLGVGLKQMTDALHLSGMGQIESAEQLLQVAGAVFSAPNVPLADKNIIAKKVFEELKFVADRNPFDARPEMALASFLIDMGQPEAAIMHLENARTLTPNKQPIYYMFAQAHFIMADKTKDPEYLKLGLESLKHAYELAPGFNEPKYMYTRGLIITKHFKEAIELMKQMENVKEFLSPQIIKILTDNGYEAEINGLISAQN